MRYRNSDPSGRLTRRPDSRKGFSGERSAGDRFAGPGLREQDFAGKHAASKDKHTVDTGKPAAGKGKHAAGKDLARPKAAHWRNAPRGGDTVVLYGWHSVKAALENPQRKFRRLLATGNAARRLAEDGVTLPQKPEIVRPDAIAALAGAEAVHQGLYAEADALPSPDIEEVAGSGIILVLDQITDPHNVGAILRSAAAFAVTAVVTTARHSPQATGVLAKAASGALEYVPIATVGNLARALDALHEHHTLLVGLDSSGEADLAAVALAEPLALVIGAEGKGLRHLTRTHCDVVARLDLPGRIKSLNVSTATAIALHVAATWSEGRAKARYLDSMMM
jgi:23S rRNA (guanosine2251-2'-O)-methyltransferase